ncbi:hypothetical protein CDL12_13661 [Handroanthus impetiginosus]|uniref:Uncharacterized protein n=1 Tax=Handroanthus impetiginosus TaxID=429701 RepID=A0A2G9H862_9LAMI|nr:hypothetical protein CDL12_22739 [Handroanthus impetiginosus]PIN13711.1 hypothetical protein CDL12_13661 [Handroanthus impetiginosus]
MVHIHPPEYCRQELLSDLDAFFTQHTIYKKEKVKELINVFRVSNWKFTQSGESETRNLMHIDSKYTYPSSCTIAYHNQTLRSIDHHG